MYVRYGQAIGYVLKDTSVEQIREVVSVASPFWRCASAVAFYTGLRLSNVATLKVGQRLSVEGGWYAVLRVPVTQSDEDLAIELLQIKSVLVHPGHFYDFAGDGYIVLSLIAVEGVFSEGVRRALDFLNY